MIITFIWGHFFFLLSVFCFVFDLISFLVIVEFAYVCTYEQAEFSVLYFHGVCLEWVNAGRLLEEGTFECRNVGN